MTNMHQQARGKFITIEGVEGVGKSTNAEYVRQQIEQAGFDVIVSREPGGTATGERIRSILLDKEEQQMTAMTELLLMFAARAQHIEEVIQPALDQGTWVLSDRFTDSSFAYQGGGRELGAHVVSQLQDIVVADCQPDLILILDLEVEVGLARASQRSAADRFEMEQRAFFERVRLAFLERAKLPGYKLIDASQSLEAVQRDILRTLTPLLQ